VLPDKVRAALMPCDRLVGKLTLHANGGSSLTKTRNTSERTIPTITPSIFHNSKTAELRGRPNQFERRRNPVTNNDWKLLLRLIKIITDLFRKKS
jgi:hypothetical protein